MISIYNSSHISLIGFVTFKDASISILVKFFSIYNDIATIVFFSFVIAIFSAEIPINEIDTKEENDMGCIGKRN